MFRDTPAAFASDSLALALSQECIRSGCDQELKDMKRHFAYMPFMHSESLKIQQEALKLFNNGKYAVAHHDIIERFGRFPHRNAILGRESTEEELEFLKQPGSSF